MKKILGTLFGLILFSCSSAVEVNYEVLTFELAKEQMNLAEYSNRKIFENKQETSLSSFELIVLNELLDSSINTYNKNHPDFKNIDIKGYNFFYIPTKNDKNEKWIFIYGLCSYEPELNRTLSQFFLVDDGGSCYIQTVINLTKNVEGWIAINSRA
ncbi:hypothetical protein [Winogradskyella thalassocola]|uniref:Lipoprotein n=1 Tax=Winogradskyella thalassocola TaxID=262004 RepID=A0A1G7YH44_9FLAO|nr:hypothetical protein [Winogradskyella thalassocola]SDG95626.1 hypothetical protein SAMN04489796_1011026 [Winogradskyella thalassocola]